MQVIGTNHRVITLSQGESGFTECNQLVSLAKLWVELTNTWVKVNLQARGLELAEK